MTTLSLGPSAHSSPRSSPRALPPPYSLSFGHIDSPPGATRGVSRAQFTLAPIFHTHPKSWPLLSHLPTPPSLSGQVLPHLPPSLSQECALTLQDEQSRGTSSYTTSYTDWSPPLGSPLHLPNTKMCGHQSTRHILADHQRARAPFASPRRTFPGGPPQELNPSSEPRGQDMVNDMAFPGSEGLCHRGAQAGGGRHIQELIFILTAPLKGWHAIPTFPCTCVHN